MLLSTHRSSIVSILAIAVGLTGCAVDHDDDKPNSTPTPTQGSTQPATEENGTKENKTQDTKGTTEHLLVIVTELEGPDSSLHYLHVVRDWPSSGELNYDDAIELGTPGVTHVEGGAIFFYLAQKGEIQKFEADKDLKVKLVERISFMGYGISGFDPEPIWVAPDVAFMLDEKSAQIARWNPRDMVIDAVDPVNPDVLKQPDDLTPDGLNVQFQLGIAAGKRLFTSVNWRNWDTNRVYPGTVLGVFDQDSPANGPQIVRDERCAASVAVGPFKYNDGFVYAVGDGAQGYDMIANPNKSPAPQCVVRMREGADEFDQDFFVDLQEVTGSPSLYMVYPMADHKVLAAMWSPDVDVAGVADPKRPGWFWELNPYYEYAIIDLEAKTSTKVEGLPRAPIQSQKTLFVDGHNYVQRFREDRGSTLHRVDADGSVTQVLDNPTGTDVQYIGRL